MVGVKNAQRATGDTRISTIGAAGQNNRCLCPNHQPCGFRTRQVDEPFKENVSGFDGRHNQNICITRYRGFDALEFGGPQTDGIVQRKRTIHHATGQSASATSRASTDEGIPGFGLSTADKTAAFGEAMPIA